MEPDTKPPPASRVALFRRYKKLLKQKARGLEHKPRGLEHIGELSEWTPGKLSALVEDVQQTLCSLEEVPNPRYFQVKLIEEFGVPYQVKTVKIECFADDGKAEEWEYLKQHIAYAAANRIPEVSNGNITAVRIPPLADDLEIQIEFCTCFGYHTGEYDGRDVLIRAKRRISWLPISE